MGDDPDFADLLNHRLSEADRSAAWLARRLGVHASTVTRWSAGQTHPDTIETVIRLCDVLNVRGTDRHAFLRAAGYVYAPRDDVHGESDGLEDARGQGIVGRPATRSESAVNETQRADPSPGVGADLPDHDPGSAPALPPKPYHRMIGRWEQLDQIMNALRDPTRKPVVAIVGLGGIGKTALAYEAALQGVREGLFEHIVWTSAKTEHFVAGITLQEDRPTVTFETLLSEIGRQCGRLDIPQMSLDARRMAVKALLMARHVLIVLDNLESITQGNRLTHEVLQILGQGKLLITSRHLVQHDRVFILDLRGLPPAEGVRFLREEGQERGVAVVAEANRAELVQLHEVTGGAPLAMKLVVGQLYQQSMQVVLEALQHAAFRGQDYPFYQFVYRHSWELLDLPAQMALVDMSVFPPLTGGAVADVEAVSQVAESDFWPAMRQLITMSLVDKLGGVNQERLALHPLTQYFIRSDITREWGQADG